MKKRLATLLAILLTIVTGAWADGPFRNHRYDSFKTLPAVSNNDIVFIGNSITNMFNWWEALGSNQRIKGRGNSGAVTQEVLDNLESMIAGQPAKVFLMIGTNDLGTAGIDNPTYVARQIETIITRIRKESPATQIYCQSILPSGLRNAEKILKTNELVSAWIAEKADAKVTYVDLYPLLNDGNGQIKNTQNNGTSANSYDNLHLTALGYQAWLKAIESYLPADCRCQIPEGIQTLGSGLGGSPGMRSTYFGALPVKTSDILMIGDEMIHGFEWHEVLGADFKDRGSGWGYPGVNIANMTAELDAIFGGNEGKVTKQTPKAICLYAGVADCNDANYNEATVKANYKALVDGIRAKVNATTPIFLMTLAPHPTAANNDHAKALNAYMQTLAESDANLHVIDLYQAAMNGSARQEKYFMGTNNAYISGLGYIAFANAIKTHVNSVLGSSYTCITQDQAQANLDRFNTRKPIGDATNLYTTIDNYVGTGIGQYPAAAVNAYKSTIEPAFTALQSLVPNTSVDFAAAKTTLVQSLNALTASMASGKQYALSTPNRNNLYAYTDGEGLNAMTSNPGYKNCRWIFESRGDGSFNIKNADKNVYMDPSAAHDTQIKMSATAPSAGWTLDYSDALGLYIIKSGTTSQLNTTDKQGNPIFNWHNTSNATNRSDTGCQWLVEDVTDMPIVTNPDPINVVTGMAQEGAATLVDGHIYTITNHQQDGSCYPLYVTSGLQVGAKNALAAKSYGNRAQFRAVSKGGNVWAFQSVLTNQWLIWKGNDSGYNNNAGVLDTYNATYCNLTITAVTNITNGKLITGKRSNGTEEGTFIQNADGTWNKWRGATVGYTGTYSDIYTFGDVTNGTDGEQIVEEPVLDYITVTAKTGSGVGTSGFATQWTYGSMPAITLAAGANNMQANADGTLNLYMGTRGNTYTITAPAGYVITGYSATVSGENNTITPSEGGKAITTTAAGVELLVSGLSAESTTFTITGQNTPNKFADFKIHFSKTIDLIFSQSIDEANWLRVTNTRSAGYALTAKDGDAAGTLLHSSQTNAADDGQLFAFVGDNENGFYIYSKKLGKGLTLTAANTNNATAVTWTTGTPTKWYLLDTHLSANNGYMLATSKSATTSMNMYGGVGQDIKFYTAPDGGGSLWNVSMVDTNPTVIHYVVNGTKKYDDANQWVGQLKIQKGSFTSETLLQQDINGQTFNAYLPKSNDEVTLSNFDLHGWKFACTKGSNGEYTVTYTADQETEYQYLGFRPDAQWYRIPAIVTAHNGDLVSIYDWRVCHSDVGFGEVDQHMRRSSNNGKTWSNEVKIADGNGGGKVFGAAFGDPALVADRESGKMTLLTVSGTTAYPYATATDHNLISVQFSEDNGQTWSEPKEITQQFWGKAGAILADADTEAASTTFAYSGFFGSGKLVQSRVVKVGQYYRIYGAMLCRGKNVQGAYVVYSDDMGQTWNLLGGDNTVKAASGSDEPKVEELPNGDVLLSCRKYYGRYFNIWHWNTLPTVSNKAGAGQWGSAVDTNTLGTGIKVGSNSCNGEILFVDCQKEDGTPAKLMLQSLPSANDRSGVEIWYKDITDPATYVDVNTFASNWTRGLRVSPQSPASFSAYSTMTVQRDGRIGFLYEEGPATYCIVYVPLTLEKITGKGYKALGDVDGNGVVNKDDVSVLTDIIVEKKTNNGRTDINKDGKVSVADTTKLISVLK